MRVQQREGLLALHEERPAGLDREHRGLRGDDRARGLDADDRHVEAEVLLRLGGLDDDGARAGDLAAAADRQVGALEGLDRDRRRGA